MKKFNELYTLIMEEYSVDAGSEYSKSEYSKFLKLFSQIMYAPSQQALTNIYKYNKDFIDNDEDLILRLLENANALDVFKNQFRNSKFQGIQDWFKEKDEKKYSPGYLGDAELDIWNDLTKGEADDLMFYS